MLFGRGCQLPEILPNYLVYYSKVHTTWGSPTHLHISPILQRPRTGHSREIASRIGLSPHFEEVLSNRRDLRVVHLCVDRIPILQLIPIGMIDEPRAIRDIMHEQTPEQIPSNDWLNLFLCSFDNGVKLRECWCGIVACPVVFAGEVDAVGAPDGGNVVG